MAPNIKRGPVRGAVTSKECLCCLASEAVRIQAGKQNGMPPAETASSHHAEPNSSIRRWTKLNRKRKRRNQIHNTRDAVSAHCASKNTRFCNRNTIASTLMSRAHSATAMSAWPPTIKRRPGTSNANPRPRTAPARFFFFVGSFNFVLLISGRP